MNFSTSVRRIRLVFKEVIYIVIIADFLLKHQWKYNYRQKWFRLRLQYIWLSSTFCAACFITVASTMTDLPTVYWYSHGHKLCFIIGWPVFMPRHGYGLGKKCFSCLLVRLSPSVTAFSQVAKEINVNGGKCTEFHVLNIMKIMHWFKKKLLIELDICEIKYAKYQHIDIQGGGGVNPEPHSPFEIELYARLTH